MKLDFTLFRQFWRFYCDWRIRNVVIFATPLETPFFCENHNKIPKNILVRRFSVIFKFYLKDIVFIE